LTKLVVGLGNPGEKFADTRHNVGSEVIAELARRHDGPKPARQGQANVVPITLSGEEVLLATTRIFMNDSGRAVQGLMARHRVRDLADLLIVLDEMELPLGTLRLRPSGSDAGHNGLKSVIQSVGGAGFPRLRLGVGRPPAGQDPIEHVLGRFRPEERAIKNEMIVRAADAVESWIENGILRTMDQFNRGPSTAPGTQVEP
jgi:peptidyl-tRNA hydrolase, PTH1 family